METQHVNCAAVTRRTAYISGALVLGDRSTFWPMERQRVRLPHTVCEKKKSTVLCMSNTLDYLTRVILSEASSKLTNKNSCINRAGRYTFHNVILPYANSGTGFTTKDDGGVVNQEDIFSTEKYDAMSMSRANSLM